MNIEPVISIIIPAYNAEKYIVRCLNSLFRQTYKNLEIIVVDDGSKDQTSVLVRNTSLKDSRVNYIYQDNGGVSSARNNGIEAMKGDWCLFVDADDWLEPTSIEELVTCTAKYNADTIVFGINNIYAGYENTMLVENGHIRLKQLLEGTDRLINLDLILCSPCNKLYRCSIIKDYQLRFPVNIKYGEDFTFNSGYYSHANAVVGCNSVQYQYDCSIPNSGVKRLYPEFHVFIATMSAGLVQLMQALEIDDEKREGFANAFIGIRWIYAINTLISDGHSLNVKTHILVNWMSHISNGMMQYLASTNSEFSMIAQDALTKGIDCKIVKKRLRAIGQEKKKRECIMAIKRHIKKLLKI